MDPKIRELADAAHELTGRPVTVTELHRPFDNWEAWRVSFGGRRWRRPRTITVIDLGLRGLCHNTGRGHTQLFEGGKLTRYARRYWLKMPLPEAETVTIGDGKR